MSRFGYLEFMIPPALAGNRETYAMLKHNRLTGRFFSALICLAVAAFAGWTAEASIRHAMAPSGPALTQILDTVYRADGSPAQGTVVISWPAFTTAAGQAVTPGTLTVTLDPSGGFNASLAPNAGATPAGTYYKAIFKLDDGTTDSELWSLPAVEQTTIGAIRATLAPASMAAQYLTRTFADANYVSLASTQTIAGAKTFTLAPTVPTPVNPTDAANKAYVDDAGTGRRIAVIAAAHRQRDAEHG